ncbi:MAG: histidine kinase [Dokdonella sp.]|uniref:sensor histidine kinase n=1 Tax=Dokdonella sp. TaxID=2291710 RepID=UPI003264A2BE
MSMSRFLMARIAAVSLAILVGALALALWRAQFDIEREEGGATEVARLFDRLNALKDAPPADIATHLDVLRAINRSPALRHLQLRLQDAAGTDLVAPSPPEPLTGLRGFFARLAPGVTRSQPQETGSWDIARADGTTLRATLQLNPLSEQQESLDNIIGMLVVLLGYALAMLVAVYWAVNRALAPMRPILDAIDHYERNDFSHRLPSLQLREMDTIGGALNHLASALGAAQDARRMLSLKLLTSQEEERARIARELHDEFGQTLTAMRADALWLTRQTAGEPDTQAVAQELTAHCERLHVGIRNLLRRLRPRELRDGNERISLRRLLGDLVQSWRNRPGQDVDFSFRFAIDESRVSDELALTLYRLTQEALTNAMRHAQATHISVELVDGTDARIEWRFTDDGVGIDSSESAVQHGNGLAGMRERVWAHAGELDIARARGSAEKPGLQLIAHFDGRMTEER